MVDDDGVDRSLAAWDGLESVVLDIDVTKYAADNQWSPKIIARHGKYVVGIDLLALTDYLDVDVHAFVDGERASAGVIGFPLGRRIEGFREEDTAERSNGLPSAPLVVLIIGKQAAEKAE